MKRLLATFCVIGILVLSCSGGDSSNNPPDNQDSEWKPIAKYSFGDITPRLGGLLADGDLLYVSGEGGLFAILDASESDTLKLLSMRPGTRVSFPPAGAGAIVKRDNIVICAYQCYRAPDSVVLFDVSNSEAPSIVGVIESIKVGQIDPTYQDFERLYLCGDSLMVRPAGILYRLASGGTLTQLNWAPTPGDMWIGDTFYYFLNRYSVGQGPFTDLRLYERGTFNLRYYSDGLPAELHQVTPLFNRGPVAYIYDFPKRLLYELDASQPDDPRVTRTLSVPGSMGLPSDLVIAPSRIVALETKYAILANRIVLLDGDFQYLKHSSTNFNFNWAVSRGNKLYAINDGQVVAFDME